MNIVLRTDWWSDLEMEKLRENYIDTALHFSSIYLTQLSKIEIGSDAKNILHTYDVLKMVTHG